MMGRKSKVLSVDAACYETIALGHCRLRQWGEAAATLQQMDVPTTVASYDLLVEALAHMGKKEKVGGPSIKGWSYNNNNYHYYYYHYNDR